VSLDDALTRSSRPDQLLGILQRAGFDVNGAMSAAAAPPQPALRMAGS
jgi:hypothetical protein